MHRQIRSFIVNMSPSCFLRLQLLSRDFRVSAGGNFHDRRTSRALSIRVSFELETVVCTRLAGRRDGLKASISKRYIKYEDMFRNGPMMMTMYYLENNCADVSRRFAGYIIVNSQLGELITRYKDGSVCRYRSTQGRRITSFERGEVFMKTGYAIDRNFWSAMRALHGERNE